MTYLIYGTLSDQSDDRKDIAYLTQLLGDWLTYHPSEPFDAEKAAIEYKKHRSEFQVNQKKFELERMNQKAKEEIELAEACRKVGESHFQVMLEDSDGNASIIGWDDTVTDPDTGTKLGTVRELTGVGWVRPSLDPRKNPQERAEYVAALKRTFDHWHTSHTSMRNMDAKVHRDRAYNVTLTLDWKTDQ